jgi:Uma2 family endonuclease
MATAPTLSAPKTAQLPPPTFHRFTIAQYHRMIELGILREHERVQLLEGLIVDKMTHNPPHDATVLLAQTELLKRLPPEWVLRIQSAITTTHSEPEPDLVVARGPARRYVQSHPRPADIALIIEVADTSLSRDREVMGPINARGRIPVYWIINLVARQVEVCAQPKAGRNAGFRQRRDFGADESVPLVIAGQELGQIPVRELLP